MVTKVEPVSDPEDVVMQQYPSPTADGQSTGPFYHTTGGPDQDGASPDATNSSAEGVPVGGTDSQMEADDLHIAAQLTQGLAQGLTHILPAPPPGDPNQDPSLQSLLPHQQAAAAAVAAAAAAQTSAQHAQAGPQPQQQPSHPAAQFVQVAAAPHPSGPALPSHLTAGLDHGVGGPPQYLPVVDTTPPRKRSKVSRACDECRRKKVKCDAQSEAGEEACSNCRRSGAQCLFSRVPQKRGPSKGYIKELADRINHIEGRLQDQGSADVLELSGSRRASIDVYPAAAVDEISRKRPHSSLSGEFSTPVAARQVAWGSEPRPGQFQRPREAWDPNSLAARPIGPKGEATAMPRKMTVEGATETKVKDIEDAVFQAYSNIIAPVYPCLASTKAMAVLQLSKVPSLLQTAFLEALYAAVLVFQPIPVGNSSFGDAEVANSLLSEWEGSDRSDNSAAELVYLQTVIFLCIHADASGPSAKSLIRPSLFARAVAAANAMNLWASMPGPQAGAEKDTEENVAARAWWAVVNLDRWSAAGFGNPGLVGAHSAVLATSLKDMVSPTAFELFRFSYTIAALSEDIVTIPDDWVPRRGVYSLVSIVENSRLFLNPDMTDSTHPLIFLTYWHFRTVAYLLMPTVTWEQIIWLTDKTTAILVANPQLQTPLTHHFTALVARCLLELAKHDKSRDEATQRVKDLLESVMAPSAWDEAIREKVADSILPAQYSVEATASQSLQRLADLATATTELSATAAAASAVSEALAAADASSTSKEAEDKALAWVSPVKPYELLGFNPLPILRRGYLARF